MAGAVALPTEGDEVRCFVYARYDVVRLNIAVMPTRLAGATAILTPIAVASIDDLFFGSL
jgi:hypothetical protein